MQPAAKDLVNNSAHIWSRAALNRVIALHKKYPHTRIGVLVIDDNLEDFCVTEENYEAAKSYDGIAVLLAKSVTLPEEHPGAGRKHIAPKFFGMKQYKHLGLLKILIEGFENQLVRRVLAIGCDCALSGSKTPEVRWIKIPTTDKERGIINKRTPKTEQSTSSSR